MIATTCSDWGCRPNPDWSHINVRHMKGVWQPSYAVDVHMDVSSPHYGCWCWPSFWNFGRILGNAHTITDGEMRWLRLCRYLSLVLAPLMTSLWQWGPPLHPHPIQLCQNMTNTIRIGQSWQKNWRKLGSVSIDSAQSQWLKKAQVFFTQKIKHRY